jgi:hypothetical protein
MQGLLARPCAARDNRRSRAGAKPLKIVRIRTAAYNAADITAANQKPAAAPDG